MQLELSRYLEQKTSWPASGRHIMAQFDDATIVVYQAYRPSIGHFAAEHGHFGGGDFSFDRMSWIKPNFLWMMYRSGWRQKPGQEVTLAIRLWRSFFDRLLSLAAPSTYVAELYPEQRDWRSDVARSDVRLQWDPDHAPRGAPVARRALQLGLRRTQLAGFSGPAIAGIEDISAFVAEQRERLAERSLQSLESPSERPYPVTQSEARRCLGLDLQPEGSS